jgi:hypothetical protein
LNARARSFRELDVVDVSQNHISELYIFISDLLPGGELFQVQHVIC